MIEQDTDWRTAWTQEWKACSKVGLMHHVLAAIHESVIVLQQVFSEHRHAFPEVLKRHFGSGDFLMADLNPHPDTMRRGCSWRN